MKHLPFTHYPLVLRTDFSNQVAWETIRTSIQKPIGVLRAYVAFVDDHVYRDLSKKQVLELVPTDYTHTFIILVDQIATGYADFPLLIVDLYAIPGREFRAVPSQIQAIENNLSLANMNFEEFAENVDEDGIFRSFPTW